MARAEDRHTSTVEGAAAFERHHGWQDAPDDRPDPSEYADLGTLDAYEVQQRARARAEREGR